MPPVEYAQVLVAGRPAAETLQIISREIRSAVQNFTDAVDNFENKSRASLKDAHLQYLGRCFSEHQGALLRITALMDVAAEELNIPLNRLRDRLLQYDPVEHRAYARTYIRNLEALALARAHERKLPNEMESKLRNENSKILERAQGVMQVQGDLQNYAALDRDILYIASIHSTSESMQQYARSLSSVAKHTLNAIGDQRGSDYSKARYETIIDGIRAVRFLARKQHSHSGFDLNQLCLSACQTRLSELSAQSRERCKEETDIKTLIELLEKVPHRPNHPGELWPFSDTKDKINGYIESLEKMQALDSLWSMVNDLLWKCRERLTHHFIKYYQTEWSEELNSSANTIIVTHGYSSTVLYVLNALQRKISPKSGPEVFIIRADEVDDLDSRLMVNALKEVDKPFSSVAVVDAESLYSFLDREVKVLVVLGAECFDDNLVVHPWGLDMGEFVKQLKHAGAYKIVIVAESYKKLADLKNNPQLISYHLDRIRIYNQESVDLIVTDNGLDFLERKPRVA